MTQQQIAFLELALVAGLGAILFITGILIKVFTDLKNSRCTSKTVGKVIRHSFAGGGRIAPVVEYEAGGKKFGIGCVDVYDEKEARDMAARMKDVVTKSPSSTGMDMAFAQVSVFHDDLSVTYLIPSDEKAEELLKTAYGDRAVFDGTSYVLKPGISRKKEMVPAFKVILEKNQKQ
jgi:hypothetical protein